MFVCFYRILSDQKIKFSLLTILRVIFVSIANIRIANKLKQLNSLSFTVLQLSQLDTRVEMSVGLFISLSHIDASAHQRQ